MGKKSIDYYGKSKTEGANTNALAAAFASGAVAAGNEVEVFDAATANLHGCSGGQELRAAWLLRSERRRGDE